MKKHLSFEFSAPRNPEETARLLKVHNKLKVFSPDFFSVTYGAGGSTKEGTKHAVLDIQRLGSRVAPHLSFGGDKPEKIDELLREYQKAGVKRVVALRGDMPSGQITKMTFARELIEFIRKSTGSYFHIDIAAYPETHPDSASVESDIKFFKNKVDAGANSAITQYFYNADAYFRYMDNCASCNINIPIVPGIMPITNYKGIVRFSKNCGAEIPRWMLKQLESYQDQPNSLKAFGLEVVTELCEKLLDGGAPGLHFYTLNQALPSASILRNLNS